MDEIQSVVVPHQGQRFFFGPRLEWAYAAFRLHSPLDMPIWWHPGSSYNISQEQDILHAWRKARIDILILNKHDVTRMPTSLLQEIERNYYVDDNFRAITCMYKKH
jgi:hypothetical protein